MLTRRVRPGNWIVVGHLQELLSRVQTLEKTVAELNHGNSVKRSSPRVPVNLPARITWKDASGAVRFASVTTRDVSEAGVFVECEAVASIPLYRLVHLQIERTASANQNLPSKLREGRVLSAVWRVAPFRRSTGTPSGYALRFLVDPQVATTQVARTTLQAVAV